MENKYSKTKFEGYTHRFKVEFYTNAPYNPNLDIYSNSGSFLDLENFLNKNKSEKIISFKIVFRTSKEQDEIMSMFIEEILKDI